MTYSHIDIDRLEAEVAFGPDKMKEKWSVAKRSDGAYFIEIAEESQDGRNFVWNIPFDIADTIPSPSGISGLRILTKTLDASQMIGTEQFSSMGELLHHLQTLRAGNTEA